MLWYHDWMQKVQSHAFRVTSPGSEGALIASLVSMISVCV